MSLEAAQEIGRAAVAGGLETLDLARIHHQALAQLLGLDGSADVRAELGGRAAAFFTEAITPIEGTHRAALEATADLTHLHAALDERMLNLAEANRELQEEIAGRATVETALKESRRVSGELLKDSQVLEKQLRAMAHKILSATEAERLKMSRQLNDEIAQALLGVHIRILALKKDVAAKHTDITREIATTQRLVEDSSIIIRRLAHEFSIEHAR